MTRRGVILAFGMVGLGAACGSNGIHGASGGAAGTGSGGGTTTSSGSTATSSGGAGGTGGGTSGPLPLPTLDADGCPGMTGVGADPNARTPIPSGVTKTYYVSPTGSDTNPGTDPSA